VYLDGALVDSAALALVDPPRRDYFLMQIDVEHPLRLRAAGVTMIQAGVPYDALRLGAAATDGEWRSYYQTRNHLHLALTQRSPTLLAGFVLRTTKQIAHGIRTGSWHRLRWRARGIADALRGRMGRTIDPYPARMPTAAPSPLLDRTYSADFQDALTRFLATRGGRRWDTLHGNGPQSRMARFESTTLVELEHHTGPLTGKRVLDFGCGTGTITPSLALRAREVVAFDISVDAADITRRRLREHDLEHVPVHRAESYRDVAGELGQFDLVVMHAVFEHVPLSVKGLRRDVMQLAFDAVAPGGHLFISESPNRLFPRDIYCTGLWFLPWTRGGSRWAYRRAIARGRHTDPAGRGPISLEERGAWGFTYWTVRRALRDRAFDVVNAQRGHDRWVRYGRRLSGRRRLSESAIYYAVTRTTGTPIVAFAPMISPLVLERAESTRTDEGRR
jgi:2-polyprenyl-3-methyl-5-hydroxy-6-metoxy-1,4-benzoquinol methylase